MKRPDYLNWLTTAFCFLSLSLTAQFKPVEHRALRPGEIPVSEPGNLIQEGSTYVLTRDISAPRSAFFLAKDAVLDLNGYTIRFADAGYQHIPNGGFEEGAVGWDLTQAPGSKITNTADVHVFIGDKLLRMKKGDIVRSPFCDLVEANRSYFAQCGVTGWHYTDPEMNRNVANEMRVSVYVEDEKGNMVECLTQYGDSLKQSSPLINRSPRLGGGFLFAHLNKLPKGKYRIAVKAETDCMIDELDIRPAMDVGIGIVEQTHPYGHYDHLYSSVFSSFYDYTANYKTGKPIDGIPVSKGKGSVTIRNGKIENGTATIVSWGIQSSATDVKMVLDNVHIKTSGINAIAVDVPMATIVNCLFEVDNPFLINRHGSNFYAVDLRGNQASEVSFSTFIGGQGCLVFKGNRSSIHHNTFRNQQAVTNHYSIMAMGDSSIIFQNQITPDRGSGIEIYIRKHIEIFSNFIKIQSSPPTCEYGREDYSVNGIRIADYRAKPGSARGAYGNKVYNNRIEVTALNFEEPKPYTPLAWAIFCSASGGDNYFFENDIVINHKAPGTKAISTGVFVGGGLEGFGGRFYRNRITTNVSAFWLAGSYGGTINSIIKNNTITKAPGAGEHFVPVIMGFGDGADCMAKQVEFSSNKVEGDRFWIKQDKKAHSYSVNWQLDLSVINKKGKQLADKQVVIKNSTGKIVKELKTDSVGKLIVTLPAYTFNEHENLVENPYTLEIGKDKKQLTMEKDEQLEWIIKTP
jgi:hypothetical protein